jgi:hypothetical protein
MPWDEFAAIYAYRLRWRPLLTIVPSSAYTTALDRESADILSSRRAAERILRSRTPTIDRVNTVWDMPSAMRTILCRYRQVSATARWQVLARAESRCGRPRRVATVAARWGTSVNVPRAQPGAAMLVRIRGVEPHGLERLATLVYRIPERYILLDGRRRFNLVAGTAADGLVISVPPAYDYPPPFAFSAHVHTLTVLRRDRLRQRWGHLTYEFDETPMHSFHNA